MGAAVLLSVLLSYLSSVAATEPHVQTLQGHVDADQALTFVYVPFQVEAGVTSLNVLQQYSQKGNNSIDLGVFDVRGVQMMDARNGSSGFRGWSGGAYTNFTISPSGSTPSYIPGPLDPGEWNVVLGPYQLLDTGADWNLTITYGYDPIEEYFEPAYAPIARALDNNQTSRILNQSSPAEIWLRGDFHLHSVYSDGHYLPQEQIDHALQQELDFLFFTEHNTYSGIEIYGALDSSNLLIGRGIEVTTRHGHWGAQGVDRSQIIEWRYDPGNDPGFEAATEQVHASGGIVTVNHPFSPCLRCNWDFDFDHNDALEVWNGIWDSPGNITGTNQNEPAVALWQSQLVTGRKVTAVGGSDSHSAPSLDGYPTTVVKSRSLSQSSILDGVRDAKVYIVQGPGMTIDMKVQGCKGSSADIGGSIPADEAQNVTVTVDTVGFNGMKACFVTDQGYMWNTSVSDGQTIRYTVPDGAKFVRAEFRNSTETVFGMTNPVWIGGEWN